MSHYADVIRLLSNPNIDYRRLVHEIAASAPEAVLAAHRAITGQDATGHGDWEKPCIELMNQGRVVEAIKMCRKFTGKSLKDAKAAVESLSVNGA